MTTTNRQRRANPRLDTLKHALACFHWQPSNSFNGLAALILALALSLSFTFVAVAQSDQVAVTFPNLAEGQTIGGKINLSVQVTAPAPIASVEYFLDDQSLARVVIAPFNFEWDSTTAAPGEHTVSAKVTDKNGNSGQAQVKLVIAKPVQVAVVSSQDTIRIGDKVTLNAAVTALVDVSRVEMLVDGQSIGRDNTAPFSFAFDTGAYSAGKHTITIRAEDILGRAGEASLDLQFAPPEQAGWVKVVIVIAVIATIAAAVIALYRTMKLSKRSYQRSGRIELRNLGNIRSRYELRAEDPANLLKFQLLLNGASLSPVTAVTSPMPSSAASPAPAAGGIKQSAGNVAKSGSAIADLLMTIGSILPSSLGGRLMTTGSNMRQAQYTAHRVQSAGGQLRDSTAAVSGSAAPARPAAMSAPSPSITTSTVPGVWQTPPVEPGEALTLNLLIDPGRPTQTMNYTFRVSSQAIDDANAAPVIESGSLEVKGISLFRLYLPFFVLAGVTILVIVVVALLLSNTGVLG